MSVSRIIATLFTIVVVTAAFSSAGHSQGVCNNPSFRFPEDGPFSLPAPRPGVKIDQVTALTAGTYVARPDLKTGCSCDLAVALVTQGSPAGFVALMRGNENGTFALHPGAALAIDGSPVALASGPIRQDIKTPFDGVIAVTSRPGENGQAHIFVPDANGNYSSPQILPVGPDPVAVAMGDFNNDGRPDVVVANGGNNSLTILFGSDAGTFGPSAMVLGLGGIPESITAGRFSEGSGPDDIAVSILQTVEGATQVGVVILSRTSSGTFAPSGGIIQVGRPNSLQSSIAAANLSGPSEGTAGRRFRDLVVAFLDHTPANVAIGRVQVLLNQGKGKFAQTQIHDLNRFPTSIKVVDLDEDGVVDLVVSAHGTVASERDGSVHFFQGRAAPAPDAGFHVNKGWNTTSSTGIRPHSLAAGRFGKNTSKAPVNIGVAAINAVNPAHNSVSVFLGNGRGAFVEPKQETTLLQLDDGLFVFGDFHSPDGNNPLQDIAFVTRQKERHVLTVLQSNGTSAFERTERHAPLFAGSSPRLITTGRFTPSGPLSIAIVDATGAPQKLPLLKTFISEGDGRFTAGPELLLTRIGRPHAIATGHFRGEGTPLDIAILSETGKLTVLFNNGTGSFTVGTEQDLGFAPGVMVASNRIRRGGRTDLLIRDANSNRFLFLRNIGDAQFAPADNPDGGFFGGAGNVNALLVGNVASAGRADPLDDVVTYDSDMTLRVFVNDGDGSFTLRPAAPPSSHANFQGARPPYVLADFGGGNLVLAAPVVREMDIGVALLEGNGDGSFTVATANITRQPFGGERFDATTKTDFKTPPLPNLFRQFDIQFTLGLAAQFRSALHGNNKPDLAFFFRTTERSLVAGMCPGDTQPFKKPIPAVPAREKCNKVPMSTFDCKELMMKPPCFETVCHTIPGTAEIPFSAFCDTVQPFGPAFRVYGNTCAD